jgi:hypothetical protein
MDRMTSPRTFRLISIVAKVLPAMAFVAALGPRF